MPRFDFGGSRLRSTLAALGWLTLAGAAVTVQGAESVPQSETVDVLKLGALAPHWVFVSGSFGDGGVRIFDGDSGKMLGMVELPTFGNFSLDPTGQSFYTTETYWTRVVRGTRQDLLTAYDARTLDLSWETALPGRLLGGSLTGNFVVSNDGHTAFSYQLFPSSSAVVVDLKTQKVRQTVQLPGCAALFPAGPGGIAALCADGSLATLKFDGKKPIVSHSRTFFPADRDPIFENFHYDRKTGSVTFLTYSGKIYSAQVGLEQPKIDGPWSVQAAAGLREDVTPPNINWLPGGQQPLGIHQRTGRIYVLMHRGELWSHQDPAEEIWVLDAGKHTLIGRYEAPGKVTNIEVSQDANPLVYATGENMLWVLDGMTLDKKHEIKEAAGSMLVVPDAP